MLINELLIINPLLLGFILGELRYRLLSPVMAYFIGHYLILMAAMVVSLNVLIPNFIIEEYFLFSVLYMLMISSGFVCIIAPVLIWMDISKFIEYNNKWNNFQV